MSLSVISTNQYGEEVAVEPQLDNTTTPTNQENASTNINFQTREIRKQRMNFAFDAQQQNKTDIDAILNNESKALKVKTWNRLDKTTKVGRIRDFVKRYTDDNHLSPIETAACLKYLISNINGTIRSSKDVNYDSVNGVLISVPNLMIDETKRGFTMKRK
jgi:hypothetical protein